MYLPYSVVYDIWRNRPVLALHCTLEAYRQVAFWSMVLVSGCLRQGEEVNV